MQYKNPILPGFYPDPSICRVEQDYYLVTSSFEYFPGIPLFHSRDLVHWRQIGHCLTRTSQLRLDHIEPSQGIWAPTIRYYNGTFYVLTTNANRDGHLMVQTENPEGEWSDPVFIAGSGFDPDLFIDEDGTAYFMEHDFNGKGITQWQIDIRTGRLINEGKTIWRGFEDRYCEAPHLYKINGLYYLIVAEGGTFNGHMIVAARSTSPKGPFMGCPQNPILTHRCHVLHEIQSTGHGDLLQAHDGSWWIVFLGTRPINRCHHLGRETFLAPVTWISDGWPVVNDNNPIELVMEADLLPSHPWPAESNRDDFDLPCLKDCWNFRRVPMYEYWDLRDRNGWLKMTGAASTLNDQSPYVFIGRRQSHFDCRILTLMDFNPSMDGEEAGLTVLMDEKHHYEIAVIRTDGVNHIIVRNRIGHLSAIIARIPTEETRITLQINASRDQYELGYSIRDNVFHKMAVCSTRYLSSEVAGGFTGAYFGMYATGNGKKSIAPAYFDWFEYQILPD